MLMVHTLVLGNYETNCYLVYRDENDECLVIDPGYEPRKVLSAAKALGLSIRAVLLTHGHFDHVGAVREIFAETDCDIYLCPDDCQMPEAMTAGQLCYTHSLQDADRLNIAGLELQVLHTPGHTPGSVCFLCENALFSGDTLFAGSCGRTDLPCGNWQDLKQSLARLMALEEDRIVYPGHGEASTLSTEKKHNPYLRQSVR